MPNVINWDEVFADPDRKEPFTDEERIAAHKYIS